MSPHTSVDATTVTLAELASADEAPAQPVVASAQVAAAAIRQTWRTRRDMDAFR
jgi:hypothetical protein